MLPDCSSSRSHSPNCSSRCGGYRQGTACSRTSSLTSSARRDGAVPGHAETDSRSSISARRSGAGKGVLTVTSRSMSLCGLSPPSSAELNR